MRKHLYITILLALLLSVTATLAPGGSMSTAQADVGDLVPLGDQLGDVGQYYSQVSPNMNSRVYIYNTASASRTAVISIYQDSPVNAAAYHTATCDIAANQVLYLRMNDVVSGTLTIEGGTGAGCTAGTGKVYRGLHHMKIVQSGGGVDLAVSVNTWTDPSLSPDLKQVSGAYQAVPSSAVASEYVLPAVLLGRTTGWDTEIVVQNVSGVTTTVTFEVSPDSGGWFNNNVATLNPNERRVFLASQLLYAPAGGGTLEQKDGWAWIKLRAFHSTNGTPQNVAVIVNMFKQGMTDGKYRAEYGSERLMQFEAPLAGTELFIPGFKVDGTNSYFRVANASTWTTTITARLYNSSGSQVGSTYTDSVNNQKAKSFAGNVFGAASGTYTLRIQSTYNVTAAAWHSSGGGHTSVSAQRVGDTDGTGTYLPFYWENHYGWQDEAQYSNTSGSGVYGGSLYKRSDGSFLSNWVFWPWGQYAQASTSFSGYNNELYAKLLGAYPLAVGRFENYSTTSDRILSYNGIAKKSGTWYVPFAPAPVLGFAWSTDHESGRPDNDKFGIAGNPTVSGSPSWVSSMNWYVWTRLIVPTGDASWTTANDYCKTKPHYILMDKGLTNLIAGHNTTDRLNAVKNLAPSACAGRPLLLANEPNMWDQANMTHVEMARQVFVYRNWPGDLHSQAYGRKWTAMGPDHGYDRIDGLTDEAKTDFVGFKDFYENDLGWWGPVPFDSLATHFYLRKDEVPNGGAMDSVRQAEIEDWRDEAVMLGVKIQVTEYGMLPNQVITMTADYCPDDCIAARIDDLHNGITSALTLNGVEYFRQLMWFSFKDGYLAGPLDWQWTNAFTTSDTLCDTSIYSTGDYQMTDPVGCNWESSADDY